LNRGHNITTYQFIINWQTAVTTWKYNNKEATILVGLDISAAIDTINHDVLISRIVNQFGVDGGASGWLRSYLTDRSQYVKLGSPRRPLRGASLASLKGRC